MRKKNQSYHKIIILLVFNLLNWVAEAESKVLVVHKSAKSKQVCYMHLERSCTSFRYRVI